MLVAELGPEGTLATSWSSVQLCPAYVNSLHGSIYRVLSKTQSWTRDWPKEEQPGDQARQLPITPAYWVAQEAQCCCQLEMEALGLSQPR